MSSQGYVEWSTIQQNSAYVDALSNPFTQEYDQVSIDMNAFNSEGPSVFTPNLVGLCTFFRTCCPGA